MGGLSIGAGNGATNGHGKFAVQELSGVKSDVGWFADMAQALHPDKPGTILHLTTGVDERLCQKYAAGSVKPSAAFLRWLLRSENGWTYLAFLMEGCETPWWIEIKKARRIAEAIRMID
jgi:hypothetical protein